MDNIIDKIYELEVNADAMRGVVSKQDLDQEWGLFDDLQTQLSAGTKNIFNEYIELVNCRYQKEKKEIYKQAFKRAIKLLVESLKE